MENHFRKTVEDRRKTLIDKLIAFSVYKEDDKHHLLELTLSELQNEYKSFLSRSHPHGDFGSIQWARRKS